MPHHDPSPPRQLLSLALALGAGLAPAGVAVAQDINAVEKRLGRAIEAGEITLEQANLMIGALRRAAAQDADKHGQNRPDIDALKRRYQELERRVKAAVDAGDLSPQDAEAKLIEARTTMFGKPAKSPPGR